MRKPTLEVLEGRDVPSMSSAFGLLQTQLLANMAALQTQLQVQQVALQTQLQAYQASLGQLQTSFAQMFSPLGFTQTAAPTGPGPGTLSVTARPAPHHWAGGF